MGTDAKGPMFAAGTEVVTHDGYQILFLPDVNNEQMQREGKPPVYHYLPNAVRLAQKPNGDYKFSFLHFVGVRSQSTTVGGHDGEEVAGGLIGFSTTAAIPPAVMAAAQNQLLDRFRGTDQAYWGWRVPVAPMFRPAPIVSNVTSITNLAPTTRGIPGIVASAPKGMNRAPIIGTLSSPATRALPRTVPQSRGHRDSNLDMWYVNLGGQGAGNINPVGENVFSGLVGSVPAAMLWSTFHGGMSAMGVWQNQRVKVWTPTIEIQIDGHWSRIQEHYSAAAHIGSWFWGADIQAEFNNMRVAGLIDVHTSVDQTIPGSEKIAEELNKRSDLLAQKFLEIAKTMIFEPPAFNEKPAEARGGFLGLGGGAAFKLRQDRVNLELHYHEKQEMCYLQDNVVPGQLDGLFDQLRADPSAEKKYFTVFDMGDWDRKIARVVKPVVNWPDASRNWVGEPVSFLSVQVGYPDMQGAIQWDGHVFQPSDGPNAQWNTAMAKKNQADVANAPAGWTPDKTFLKRKVHFAEPPSELENPYVRCSVERNEVELDAGPVGSLVDDINNEVRVDNVGALNVGPIFLGVVLEGPKQIVEVTFQAAGKTLDGHDRVPVKFSFNAADQDEPRYWMTFTGQADFQPKYSYQVRVVVKGSIMTHGQEWIGPWVETTGNGPLLVRVPTAEDEGVKVVFRSVASLAVDATAPRPGAIAPAASAPTPAGRPPSREITVTPPAGRPPLLPRPATTPKAVDDPFDVPGFMPREIVMPGRRATTDAGTSKGVSRGPAGAPPAVTSGASTNGGSKSADAAAMTIGGYALGDDGPAY